MKFDVLILVVVMVLVVYSKDYRTKSKGITIQPVSQVKWEKLNPARGNKSPQAATLWGNRQSEVETAFLAKFVNGFSSPPHIHNVSYRAIVIDGLIHNDDPQAAVMWMPKGSFWTQPAGEAHITSAKAKNNIVLVEIDKGPYLVKPENQKFDNGERPFNIHASNTIWTQQGKFSSAPLWKNSEGLITGTMLKFSGKVRIKSKFARLVIISGKLRVKNQIKTSLAPGSLITLKRSRVYLRCMEKSDCLLYVKTNEKLNVR